MALGQTFQEGQRAQDVLSDRENTLRTIRFEEPEWIPCRVSLTRAIWHRHRESLEDVVVRYPNIFGPHERGGMDFDEFPPSYRAGEEWMDEWGCVWHNLRDGMRGQPKVHPLEDWSHIESFRPPNVSDAAIQERMAEEVGRLRREGRMVWGGAGRFFERLHFLRGYRNLMMDLVENPPELERLIGLVLDHSLACIEKWIEAGADGIRWGDDLGTQTRPMMSRTTFRRHLFPGYSKMCRLARDAGCETYLHSDGRILELMDDLMAAGFTIINPQVNINDIGQLERSYKGKVCLDADIDRQHILPRGTPGQVRNHVKEIVERLGSKDGGLMMIAGVYADVPLENIEALGQAMDEYQYYYS